MNTILKAIGSFGGNSDKIKADPKNIVNSTQRIRDKIKGYLTDQDERNMLCKNTLQF